MLRRKQSNDPQGTAHGGGGVVNNGNGAPTSNPLIPLGGDVSNHQLSPLTKTRRRKKKKGCVRSCLIRCRIIDDGRSKTIESMSNKPRSSGRRGSVSGGGGGGGGFGDDTAMLDCSATICILICFFIVTMGLYNAVLQTDDDNLIIRSTTKISPDLMSSLLDYRPPSSSEAAELPILFYKSDNKHKNSHQLHHHAGVDGEFYYPSKLGRKERRDAQFVDFGDIDLKLLAGEDQKRQVYILVEDLQGDARSLDQERDDDYDAYWNFDDDILRNPYMAYDEYDKSMEGRCRRVSWHRYNLPNCNTFHEMDLITNTPKFVGDGAYREVFVTKLPFLDSIENTIFKEIRWDLEQAYDDFEYVRMDAFVTERLTSNKHIVDIYGFCGLSMLTEYFAHGDIEDDVVGYQHHRKEFNPLAEDELVRKNDFTGSQKLNLALDMVEAVEALHNFKDGVIVHDDIQLCQFLWTDKTKTSVKLNDFNRAEIMLWDEQARAYCKYKNGRGHGDWRAPEEYKDLPLDEKIDIWSLGNNFYSLLTGYYPFFNVEDDKDIQKKIKKGETAAIDPRFVENSFAESKLVEVIERCFVYDPEDRADINEIKQILLEAIAENEEREKRETEEARQRAKVENEERERKRSEEEPPKGESRPVMEVDRIHLSEEQAAEVKRKAAIALAKDKPLAVPERLKQAVKQGEMKTGNQGGSTNGEKPA